MLRPKSILITGASSGIGAALAEIYAAEGVSLFLNGRAADRLESVAQSCRAAGAAVDAQVIDVTDGAAMARWIDAADAAAPLDLVIVNAGISGRTSGMDDGDSRTRAILAVNLDGAVNTTLPALARMRARRRGQIALMSSLAGFRGLPDAAAYSASKAALRCWGEALRAEEAANGVAVSVICPGYVVSRMTDARDGPLPMLMQTEPAARRIRDGLARNCGRIAFPLTLYGLALLYTALPGRLVDVILRRRGTG